MTPDKETVGGSSAAGPQGSRTTGPWSEKASQGAPEARGRPDAPRDSLPPERREGPSGLTRIGSLVLGGARRWVLILVYVALVAAFSALRPGVFLSIDNFLSILSQASAVAILAIGLTVVLAVGDFDLSFASGIDVVSVVTVLGMTSWGLGSGFSFILAVGVGVAMGLTVGWFVTRLGSSLVVTLAFGSAWTGAALAISETSIIEGLPASFRVVGTSRPFGLPAPILVMVGAAFIVALILRFTLFGRYVRAVGGNPTAARWAGISENAVRIGAYAIMGVSIALAAMIITAKNNAYYPNTGLGLLLPPYVAAFLGLAVGRRREFNVLGSVIGIILLGTLQTGLLMLNQKQWLVFVASAFVLVAALYVSRRRPNNGG